MRNIIDPRQVCDGLYGELLKQERTEAEKAVMPEDVAIHGLRYVLEDAFRANEPLTDSLTEGACEEGYWSN